MDFIPDIRGLRVAKKIKQKDLAEAVGISASDLAKFERGLVNIDDVLLGELLAALKVSSEAASGINFLKSREIGEGYITARPTQSTLINRKLPFDNNKLPIIDLFCGVGGFSFGFELTERFQVVAGIDLLNDRLSTFSLNHPHANAYGQDIRSINSRVIEEENIRPYVIVGGPPCQGFSSLRPFRNIEWNDPRNNLAEEFIRITADLKPEWVVFENVVGLLTYQNGEVFKGIQGSLETLGYKVSARIMNAAFYGLPQNRERLIIVGSLRGKNFKWPAPTHFCNHRSMARSSGLTLQPERGILRTKLQNAITVEQAIGDLPPIMSGEKAGSYDERRTASDYGQLIRNGARILTLHEATSHSEEMLNIIKHAGKNIYALPPGMVSSGFSSCYSRLSGDEPSTTITVNFVHPASNRCIHPTQHRALTPREGARLQGFFDTFNFHGSRSQIVKQIGNAVPPLLGKSIATAILESE